MAEVVIERDDAVDFGAREVQLRGEHGHGRRGNEPELRLNAVEDFDECAGTRSVGRYDAEYGFPLCWGKGLLHLGRER